MTEYLIETGFHLGSMVMNKEGDIAGVSGFMPAERLLTVWTNEDVKSHINLEAVPAFVLSGLCDQAVLDPDVLLDAEAYAMSVVYSGSSLN